MPMERAEPSIMLIAASIVSQFKSFIFCCAISLTCAFDTCPTGSRPGGLAAGGLRRRLQLRRLFQKIGNRRRPEFEGEGFVLVYGDGDGNWHPFLHLLRLRVEILAKLHDVEAALTQSGADRRRRIGGRRGHLQLQKTGYFLRHLSLPSEPASPARDSWSGPGARLKAPSPPTRMFSPSRPGSTRVRPGWRGRRG